MHIRFLHIITVILYFVFNLGYCYAQIEISKVEDRVFRIISESGSGTGFLVSSKGHIATNHHVIRGESKLVAVRLKGNKVHTYKLEIIAKDEGLDMAVVQALKLKDPPLTLSTRLPKGSTKVYALGYPGLNDDPIAYEALRNRIDFTSIHDVFDSGDVIKNAVSASTATGSVEDVKENVPWPEKYTKLDQIQHNAPIKPGNSGGPLFDSNYVVIGLNTLLKSKGAAASVRISGSSYDLIKFLRENGVKPKVSSKPISLGQQSSGLKLRHLLLIALVTILAVFAIFLSTASHRKLAQERVPGNEEMDSLFGNLKQTLARPKERWILDGRDPNGQIIRIEFTDKDLEAAEQSLLIGRQKGEVDIHIEHSSISRQHAEITRRNSSLYLEDRQSSNGTFVNGERIGGEIEAIKLKDGNEVRLGEVSLVFTLQS